MITFIAAALLAICPTQSETQADPANIAYLIDQAPVTCARVEAYQFATGHDPDIDHSVELFMNAWHGVAGLDELSALYRGIVVGCAAAS